MWACLRLPAIIDTLKEVCKGCLGETCILISPEHALSSKVVVLRVPVASFQSPCWYPQSTVWQIHVCRRSWGPKSATGGTAPLCTGDGSWKSSSFRLWHTITIYNYTRLDLSHAKSSTQTSQHQRSHFEHLIHLQISKWRRNDLLSKIAAQGSIALLSIGVPDTKITRSAAPATFNRAWDLQQLLRNLWRQRGRKGKRITNAGKRSNTM